MTISNNTTLVVSTMKCIKQSLRTNITLRTQKLFHCAKLVSLSSVTSRNPNQYNEVKLETKHVAPQTHYLLHATTLSFNNYTGGQSVSFVLLWQPSNCIDLLVIDYILCYSRKINMMMMMMSSKNLPSYPALGSGYC